MFSSNKKIRSWHIKGYNMAEISFLAKLLEDFLELLSFLS